jgi:hypothetical protein
MKCCINIQRGRMEMLSMVTETIETCVHACVCVCMHAYKAILGLNLHRVHAVGKMKCFTVITLLFGSTAVVIMI